MRSGVMDGDRWIAQRLAFLRELLRDEISAEQRGAIEAEIASLSSERGIHRSGNRLFWWARRRVARARHPGSQ